MSSPHASTSDRLRTWWRERSTPISAAAATMNPSISRSWCTPADCTKTRWPNSIFITPSARGERTALWLQQNRTEPGSVGMPRPLSAILKCADHREQPPRGGVIGLDPAFEPVGQDPRAFVVDAAPAHVDGLDPVGGHRLDRIEV